MGANRSPRRDGSPSSVEPIPDEPAAIASLNGENALLIADYHAGVEAGLRYERGVDVPSRAGERRERLVALIDAHAPDRLVVLGDLMHSIGDPGGAERGELEVLFETLPDHLPVTLVKGNHDGAIEDWLADLEVLPGSGTDLGGVGVCHGHTWPAPAALETEVLCLGHEHPCVRLEDEVGGSRVERAWLRGRLDPGGFAERPEYEGLPWIDAEATADGTDRNGKAPAVVVLPAFNDLVGGTWVNVEGQSFLAPFFPDGLRDGEAYLLDGTRLGPYDTI